MKREKREIEEARLDHAIAEALEVMGIECDYALKHVYDWGHDGDCDVDADNYTRVHLTTAMTNASWQYKSATIRWFMLNVMTSEDERLFAVVVHELVHVLLNPIDSLITADDNDKLAAVYGRMNEYVTETLTRVILHAAGTDYP